MRISGQVSVLSRQQKYFRTRENRNFSTVKSTEKRIFNLSLMESAMMITMAALQVFIVRWFFTGGRKGKASRYQLDVVHMLIFPTRLRVKHQYDITSAVVHVYLDESYHTMPLHQSYLLYLWRPLRLSSSTSRSRRGVASFAHPTFSPASMTIYSSPTIILISSSTMKLSWSGVRFLLSMSNINRAKSL